jgi:hypothetical protein
MHAFGSILEAIAKHSSAKAVIKKAPEIVTFFRASHIPGELIRNAEAHFGDIRKHMSGLKSNNSTRMTSVQLCMAAVLNNMMTLKKVVTEHEEVLQG